MLMVMEPGPPLLVIPLATAAGQGAAVGDIETHGAGTGEHQVGDSARRTVRAD